MEKNLNNYPSSLKTVRKWFPALERFAPPVAGYIAKKLFFSPLRYETPQKEKEIAAKARPFKFWYKEHELQAYEWGAHGPVVILLHGWSGRATQLFAFVEPLLAAGFRVVAFDAPGHHASPGNYSDLVHFSESLTVLANQFKSVHTVIGHSMGGAAALYAFQSGLQVEKLVTIGSPSIAADIIKNFTVLINGSEKTGKVITDYIKKRYGKPFEQFSGQETGKHVQMPVLVIHDENDSEVSVRSAHAFMPVLKQGQFMITKGLGHTRILRDNAVVERAVGFLKESVVSEVQQAV